MDDVKTYFLEELKQSDDKMHKIDDIQLGLVKFYFTTVFSLSTVIIALVNYKIYEDVDSLITLFLLLPLFCFGWVVHFTFKKLLIEYEGLEHTRNQVSEFFLHGSIKNEYKVNKSPFRAFYSLISWIVFINFIALVYRIFPFLRSINISVVVIIISSFVFLVILSTLSVVALNNARRKSRDARRIADVKQVQTALELYFNDNNKYPVVSSWEELSKELRKRPTYMSNLPIDPKNHEGFVYKYQVDFRGQHYIIDFKLEEDGDYEASPDGMEKVDLEKDRAFSEIEKNIK
ncbi:MAG: hypothetical protein WC415_01980 [Patescibacteria group bacterium]